MLVARSTRIRKTNGRCNLPSYRGSRQRQTPREESIADPLAHASNKAGTDSPYATVAGKLNTLSCCLRSHSSVLQCIYGILLLERSVEIEEE